MKKWIAAGISFVLLFSANSVMADEAASAKTMEAPSEWASKGVDAAMDMGIIEKWDYEYKAPVTHKEFSEMVYNLILFMKKEISTELLESITDTNSDDYLTREEAAVIIVRVLNHCVPNMPVTELYYDFEDGKDISDWASNSVQVVCNLGLMKGVGDNSFEPKGFYTVEQAIVTLVRTIDCVEAAGLIVRNDEVTDNKGATEIEIAETIELSSFYISEAIKLAEKAGELARTEEFVNLYVANDNLKEMVKGMAAIDYSKPAEMYYVAFNFEEVVRFYEQVYAEEGLEEIDFRKMLEYNRFNLSYFASMINGRYGAETLAATSVLSNYKGYIMPEDFKASFGIYLKYDSDYSVLVSYSEIGDGVIEGRLNFVRNGDKADMLSFMTEIYQTFGKNCVSIKIIK